MDEDSFDQLPMPEAHSSPIQNRRLKRLKKATEAPKSPLLDSLLQDDDSVSPKSYSKSPAKSLDSGGSDGGFLASEPRSKEFEREKESEEFDELFPWEGEPTRAKRVLDFNDDASGDGFGSSPDSMGDNDEGKKQVSEGDGNKKKDNRKRAKGDGNGKESKKKKKKEDDSVGANSKPKVSKRKENKEKKVEVAQFVEHQRQLRERRDVAFKPLSVVQKPVSSVLERIRQRKKEVSAKALISVSSQFSDPLREIMVDSDTEDVVIMTREASHEEALHKDQVSPIAKDDRPSSSSVDGSDNDSDCLGDVKDPSKMPLVEAKETSAAFRAPTSDTQDLFSESQPSETQDGDHLNAELGSSQDEDLAPSLPSMNLKLDSAPLDDSSSEEEEESDKENVQPRRERVFGGNLSPKGDPVKDFLDEEALEEDDSDDDRRRFEDEGEDDIDAEEIAEMIATDYKEQPVDRERRDELHQQWLAQQDEAGTEHLLQRLKYGAQQKDATLLDEEDEEKSIDGVDDDFGDEDQPPASNAGRINTKKLRQMIPLMFTDKDDGYVSSDDEEMERRLNKQLLLGKIGAKEELTFVSPAEDESSREVFGRIKKLNVVPETKKKAKTSSFFENLVKKGSSSDSSKSSFLHRTSSIPVSSKRGSNTVKGFIFGRDDSNSRTSVSALEEEPKDVVNQAENSSQRKRTFAAKFSSQARTATQGRAATSDSTSLIDILKRGSVLATRDDDAVDHQAMFAAFKSSRKTLKIEARS